MNGVNVLKRDDFFMLENSFEKKEVKLDSGSVFVRSMTAKNAEMYESYFQASGSENSGKIRAALIAKTLCNEDGALQFEEKDIEKIASLPINIIKPIFEAALLVNKMSTNAVDDAKKN